MPDVASSDTFVAEPQFATLTAGLASARIALAGGDLPSALATYSGLRRIFPDAPEPYWRAAAALAARYNLDEADILLREAAERFPADAIVVAAFARNALDRYDIPAALNRWEKARGRFPDDPAMVGGLAAALRQARRYRDAEALLREARTRFPNDPELFAEQARVALARLDFAAAVVLWRTMREKFPDRADALAGEADALVATGRFDDADSILADSVARFPNDLGSCVAHARVATARHDWAEASRRWETVRERHPGYTGGFLGQAAVWRDLGQFDAADSVLTEAAIRFPDDPETRVAFAAVSDARGDSAAATARWAEARLLFPGHVGAAVGGIDALGTAGRYNDADALARDTMRRFPTHPDPALAYARLAQARQDEPEANLRSERVKAWFPWLHGEDTDQTPPESDALPVHAIGRAESIRLALTGFHLSYQISLLFGRMLPFRDRLKIEWINAGMDIGAIRSRLPDGWLHGTDIYFEESMVGNAATKRDVRELLPAVAEIRTFPTSTVRALWPFHGPDPRLVAEPPIYNGGRYVDPDRIAAALANPMLTDDALFDMYMEITEAAPLDLDAMYAADLRRLAVEEKGHDVQMTPFVAAHFQDEMLFAAPHERCTPIVKEVARQLLATPMLREICDLDTALAGLDRLTTGWRAHGRALPVHPRVARELKLSWWSPDRLYELGHNSFTFRDYFIRYMRWSPWLA